MSTRQYLKVAIHHRPGSFSDRWIEYCKQHSIDYAIVNCYDNNIINTLRDYDVLLWHWAHHNYRAIKCAYYILFAAEDTGLKVFPSSRTCHTFDNKIAQKYQLESIGAPLVPTYIFYDKESALDWVETTHYPKVFKLSRGAGAQNVRLVTSVDHAKRLVNRAFTKGFKQVNLKIRDNLKKLKTVETRKKFDLLGKTKRIPNTLQKLHLRNLLFGKEIGYAYFQEFLPDNDFDTRVVIIGNRAFAFRRRVRPGDFRASGSGLIDYDINSIKMECIQLAFEVSNSLGTQSIAFDFVYDESGTPRIIETSYAYADWAVHECPGCWDDNLNWHPGNYWPQDLIIENLLENRC